MGIGRAGSSQGAKISSGFSSGLSLHSLLLFLLSAFKLAAGTFFLLNSHTVMIHKDVSEVLRRRFGFESFRQGQRRVIETVLAGRDCLAVMPTGGGKSLCYQLPALMRPGLTLVVSPLIALMKDQVDGLSDSGIAATFFNSSLSSEERYQRLRDIRQGKFDIVYVAPERFRSSRFLDALESLDVNLFAVDEAHCVSMWGHDFRPDYLRLAPVLSRLGHPQVLCLTATATPEVREDIIGQLKLGDGSREEPQVVVRGFSRPSLTLAVKKVRGRREKLQRTCEIISEHETGIVYCATRKNVELVVSELSSDSGLRSSRVTCAGYHAGMSDEVRRATQDRFARGDLAVVVSTNAFGMGIDRADLRALIHYDVPGSLENYYQEVGRAGRDGKPSYCELLFNYADVRTQEFFIEGNNPSPERVRFVADLVWRLVERHGGSVRQDVVVRSMNSEKAADKMATQTALGVLSRLEVVYRRPNPEGEGRVIEPGPRRGEFAKMDLCFLEEKERRDRARLRRLLKYVNGRTCRHAGILKHFGDPAAAEDCGDRCDNCRRSGERADRRGLRAPTENEWVQIQKVLSAVARLEGRFGRGRVVEVLSGSRAQSVLRLGLDRIKSYGTLQSVKKVHIHKLLDELEASGCVETVGEEYPKIELTSFGWRAMQRKVDVALCFSQLQAGKGVKLGGKRVKIGGKGELGGKRAKQRGEGEKKTRKRVSMKRDPVWGVAYDPQKERLIEALKEWRLKEASGKPAFTVFNDRTLMFIAEAMPTNKDALLSINGIGPAKLRAFGDAIIDLVKKVCG